MGQEDSDALLPVANRIRKVRYEGGNGALESESETWIDHIVVYGSKSVAEPKIQLVFEIRWETLVAQEHLIIIRHFSRQPYLIVDRRHFCANTDR